MNSLVDGLRGLRLLKPRLASYVWFWLMGMLAVSVLTGCGSRGAADSGGGGAGSYSISLPDTLEVTVNRGDAHSLFVDVAFNGDGLIVGYPTGSNTPSWLTIWAPEVSQSPARVELGVQAYDLSRGTHRATLRFITGNADTGEHIYKDVQLTVHVEERLFLYSSNFSGVTFDSFNGASVPAQQIYIAGGEVGDDWSLEVEYVVGDDWLEIDNTQGVVKTTDSIIFLRPNTVNQGYYQATIRLFDKDNNYSGEIDVNYQSTYLVTLEGDTYLGTLSSASAPEDLRFALTFNPNNWPEGQSTAWTLETDQQWLVPEQTEGNFAGQQSLYFIIDPDALALEGESGSYSLYATISLIEASGVIGRLEHQVGLRYELDQRIKVVGDVYFEINQNSEIPTGVLTVQTPDHGVLSHNVPWTATSSEPWLRLENTSGATRADSTLLFTVDAGAFASLDGTPPQVEITIEPDHPQYAPITVYPEIVVDLPKVTAVTPNIYYQGQSSTIKIFGKNFIAGNNYRFMLADEVIEGTAQSTSMISARVPLNLSVGHFQLQVANKLGLDLNVADITIKSPEKHSFNRWVLSSPYDTMVSDPWRDSIYFYGASVDAIGQINYLLDFGEITTPSEQISSMAFTSDGTQLIIARYNEEQVDLQWLAPESFSVLSNAIFTSPLLRFSQSVKIMPVFGGEVYVHMQNGVPFFEGIEGGNLFVGASGEVFGSVSNDGTTISIATLNELNIFDATGNLVQRLTESMEDMAEGKIAISRNGLAILVGNKFFNQHESLGYALFGELERNQEINSLALAPDASEAFVQHYENNQTVIYRYDLTGDEAREVYSADIEPVAAAIAEGETVLQMVVSDDGGALFVLCLSVDKTHSVFYTIPL